MQHSLLVTSEEVLRLVPKELREASLALGATKARTILKETEDYISGRFG